MTLLELHMDTRRIANALEEIADLLQHLVHPPAAKEIRPQQATLDDLHIVTPEDVDRAKQQQTEFGGIHQVVPGSEAFNQALMDWEHEQRRLHGEGWKAPQDWQSIFASAARDGAYREPAPDASQEPETAKKS